MTNQSLKLIIDDIKRIDNSFWQLAASVEICIDLYELTGEGEYLQNALDVVLYLYGSRAFFGAYNPSIAFTDNPFNDDLLWWCMSALRFLKYAPEHLKEQLRRDIRLCFDIVDRRGNTGNGILWNGDWLGMHNDKACCSNFSYVIVAAALGELGKAEHTYNWAVKNLLHDSFLSDRLDRTDRVEDEATYNYGLLLLAAKQLGKPYPAARLPGTELYLRKEQHEYNLEFAPIILMRGMRAWGLDISDWFSISPRKTIYTSLLMHYINIKKGYYAKHI